VRRLNNNRTTGKQDRQFRECKKSMVFRDFSSDLVDCRLRRKYAIHEITRSRTGDFS